MKLESNHIELIQLTQEEFKRLMSTIPFFKKLEYTFPNSSIHAWDLCSCVHFNDGRKTLHFNFDIHANGEKRFVQRYVNKQKKVLLNSQEQYHVFVAPYISEESAQLLYDSYLNYMDLSGNCYLVTSSIIILNSGKPNKYIQKRERYGFFQKKASAASIVLRTMLDKPYACWQVKRLSELTETSLGTVSNVKNFLKQQGWIQEYPHGFQLKNIKDILYTWAKEYHQRPSQVMEFYSLDSTPEIEAKITAYNCKYSAQVVLGGFSAAARYAPTVRYKKAQAYVPLQELERFTQELLLKKVTSGGNIIITIPHDDTPCMFSRTINGDPVTSPTQTIIDLLASPNRGEEAADAIILKQYREDT